MVGNPETGLLVEVQIISVIQFHSLKLTCTGPRSAVGNESGYRCSLTADLGVASSIPARSHTFVEIDHEIILLPSADSFKKGFCQLQAKVCAQITG